MIKVKGYHFILFLNIPKYSGGTNPWGYNTNDAHFQPQSMNDGKIEVIGLYTSHLVKIQIGIGGDRICQAKHIKLTTSTTIPIQIDGEPARLLPSIIEITHKNQATMLEHVKSW
jgi:diacylglycerol kinase (ATP)